jgi:hypothetical protein
MQNNDGSLCEIDETRNQFSLRKWTLLPLLIIATIVCGYFALPTIKTVAVTKSVERVKSGYVTKNIEDIKIGDEVFAYDVTTGKTSKYKVTDTFERTSDHLRYLTVCDSKGTQIFETTDSHPFWVVTDKPDSSRTARETVNENDVILQHENITTTDHGYYVEAKDLEVGDTFISANNEVSVLVATQRKDFPEGITVYNFTVEDNHNYFVIANLEAFQNGEQPVLVHNANYHQVNKQNLESLGLDNINLHGRSYNSGRKILERAGFVRSTTTTGRIDFTKVVKDRKITVSFDSGKALAYKQSPHWHILKDGSGKYNAKGKFGKNEHVPAQ